MAHVPKREADGGRTHSTPAAGPRSPAQGGTEEEKKLVRRAQGGDALAYEELVRGHQQRIFAVVGGILRRREDIEDVAQQVFMKAAGTSNVFLPWWVGSCDGGRTSRTLRSRFS